MPTYDYKCEACEHEFELKQSFADKPKKQCPVCKKRKLYKVLCVPHAFVKLATSEIKTLGHLAHRNTEEMGKYKLDSLKEKDPVEQRKKKAKEKAPWWRPGTSAPNRKLAKLKPLEQKKYIEGK
jgi:putative FmdB family regulatory protein